MMQFSAQGMTELTKLVVRDPSTAFAIVKAARLPVPASVMMIALAGVIGGFTVGVLDVLTGTPDVVLEFDDGRTATVERAGPILQAIYATATALALAVALLWVGRRLGGGGSAPEVLAAVAVLQLVMTVILVAQAISAVLLPMLSLILMIFGLYVFLRGLAHAVNVVHDFNNLARSAGVICLSFLGVIIGVMIAMAVFGLGPQATMLGEL
ncbi:YIP1 family protein [Thalassorhabdomicrobium marinisediminis]|uniref:YIP1 family protein n=1 Tax=Thalassorhabdomicrobium marinisediminis TaxID=2170577 RepID=UPI002491F14A|nr:YIP1 family protein [Thalassorhabdomicrobium marinisediminis]